MDSKDCLRAWGESLGGITYPLLSDFWPHGQVAQTYGVLRPDGKSERAIFVIDKNGVIRYVDVHDIDLQPDNEELFRVLAQVEGVPVPKQKEYVIEAGVQKAEPGVEFVMYCTNWCPECRRARAFFAERGLRYKEVDISKDRASAQVVRGWTGGYETTPTFDVKGTIVVNFNRPKLMELLGIRD